MTIVLCSDEKFAMPCAVCIVSLFENNADNDFDVVILTDGFSPDTEKKLLSIGNKYNRDIRIINIDDSRFASLKVSSVFPKSIYYRFLIPSLLPECHKAMYMDCDMVVNAPLNELWETPLDGMACAAVEDQTADDVRHSNRTGVDYPYFNSGLLLMNLDYWRSHNLAAKCVEFIAENPERCLYPDQDALNHILAGKTVYLPYRYNFQHYMFLNKYELFLHRNKWNDIDRAMNDIAIMHYCFMIKPWNTNCPHPDPGLFRKYLRMTPWKGYRMKKYSRHPNSFFRKTARNIRKALGIRTLL